MKAKLIILFETTYNLDPDNYPENATFDEMLKIDIANSEEDPFLTLDLPGEWIITGKLLEG